MPEYKVTLTARIIAYVKAPPEWDTADIGQAARYSIRLDSPVGVGIEADLDWIEVEEVFRLPNGNVNN